MTTLYNIRPAGRRKVRVFQNGYGVTEYDRKTLDKMLTGTLPVERREVLVKASEMLKGKKGLK